MGSKRILLGAITALAVPVCAFAQDLVYEPVNPSFGGNAFNSAHLLAIANAQNDYEAPVRETTSQSELDRFIRSLQSRLLSSLSSQVANAIFGEDAQDEGIIRFGDQTVEFVRTLDGIVLTITDADGTQTVITIPVFTSSSDTGDGSAPPTTQTSSARPLSYQGTAAAAASLPGGSPSLLMGPSSLATSTPLSATGEDALRLGSQAPIQ